MPRLPSDLSHLAAFSTENWQRLDGFYGFWTERWKRTMDFIRSLHWQILQQVDLGQLPKWKRYPVVGMTLSLYNDYLTQFLQSRVRYSAVPASPDPADISSAELADTVLRYTWDKLEMDYAKIDLGAWLLATGNADLRVFWNTNTGDMVPLVTTVNGQQVPVNPETLQPDPNMQQPVMVDAGEIGIEVIPPQLVRWNLKRAHGAMVGYLLSYDDAEAKYGKELAEKLSYGKTTGSLGTDLMNVIPNVGTTDDEEAALVIEHSLPRSSKYPNGLWWTVSNRQFLTQPMPLPTRSIPLVHFRWVPMPGHPTLGLTPLYDVTFSNKAYDEILGKMLEWLNKVVPKTVRKTGDGLQRGEFTDEPGQEIVVQPGAEPDFLAPPAPPEQFFRAKQEIQEDVLLVGGYKLRRQQQVPPGEATGRIRQPPRTVNEGEQVALAIINAKPAWQKLGYILLDYVGKFYTEPRVVAVTGPDRTYQWREFKGSDLANLQATIHVDELPLYTWNRQSLRDTVIGVLGSPAAQILFTGPDGQIDRERVNAAMEAAGIDVAPDTLDSDIMEARNEEVAFANLQEGDEPPQVMPWQNDAAHLEQHSRVPKSLRFKGWPEPVQKAFLDHMSQHEQKIAQAQQAQQEQMLGQEKMLRDIRAQAETSQDVKTELGKQLVAMLAQVLSGQLEVKPPEKKS